MNQDGRLIRGTQRFAVGQTELGLSASSSYRLPLPPNFMLLLMWRWYPGDSQRGDGSPEGLKHVGLLKETAGQAKETYTLTLISYTHSRATISHAPLGLASLVTPPVCVPWPSSCQPLKINHPGVAVTEFYPALFNHNKNKTCVGGHNHGVRPEAPRTSNVAKVQNKPPIFIQN